MSTERSYRIIDDVLWVEDPDVTKVHVFSRVDISALVLCKNLEYLNAPCYPSSELPVPLPKLRFLNLSFSPLVDFKKLCLYPSLEILHVCWVKRVRNYRLIRKLPQLQEVRATGTGRLEELVKQLKLTPTR